MDGWVEAPQSQCEVDRIDVIQVMASECNTSQRGGGGQNHYIQRGWLPLGCHHSVKVHLRDQPAIPSSFSVNDVKSRIYRYRRFTVGIAGVVNRLQLIAGDRRGAPLSH
jgi:hypothetical protein